MNIKSEQKKNALVIKVAQEVREDDREPIRNWLGTLLELQASDKSSFDKARLSVAITARAKVVWPIVKLLATNVHDIGWKNKSPVARWAIAGSAIGLTFFTGSGAGIAALGGAIGVPLWIVLGGGAGVARLLYKEFVEGAGQNGTD